MAYTPPTFDASGTTWAQLKAMGFSGHVRNAVSKQTSTPPSAQAVSLANMLMTPRMAMLPLQRASDVMDNYVKGLTDKASTKQFILDLHAAYGIVSTAIGEMGVLVDAN